MTHFLPVLFNQNKKKKKNIENLSLASPVDSVKHATGPLLIEIEKSPGSTIGISLTQKWIRNNRSVIVIDHVKAASIADRSVFLVAPFHLSS